MCMNNISNFILLILKTIYNLFPDNILSLNHFSYILFRLLTIYHNYGMNQTYVTRLSIYQKTFGELSTP